ncbi:MAG: ABC transporter permease [Bacteroidota bacterium]
MDQIWIVLKSEFLRRVRSRWFVLTTLLGPIVMVALTVLPGVITAFAFDRGGRTVAVIDETGRLTPIMQTLAGDQFELVPQQDRSIAEVRQAVIDGEYEGYLHLTAGVMEGTSPVTFYSPDGGGLSIRRSIQDLIDQAVQRQRLLEQDAPPEVLDILNANVGLDMVKLNEEGEEEADQSLAISAVGFVMGFIIYFAVFIYGGTVMYAVIEEKASRVVEVVISSVKPFNLLMGKLLGVGAMGFLQMVLWLVLIVGGATALGFVASASMDPATLNLPADASQQQVMEAANLTLPDISPVVYVWFLLFFLGGYFLYASLFAAIGSAVEQQQDAQGLTFPLTFLVIIPILFITFIIESPNSTLSVVLSMIPFFSPILMVVRVAVSDVSLWQVLLSYSLLIGTFVGSVWLSSRIYRVGILMYGKKPSIADLIKWSRYA